LETYNDWIKFIKTESFTKVYNYLIISDETLLFDISSNKVAKIVGPLHPNYLVISHFHLDHHSGKSQLKKYFNTKFITHKIEALSIESLDGFYKNYNYENGINLLNELHLKFWGFEECVINIKVEDNDIFNLGDYKLRVVHTPGTSPGHICLFEEKSKILFAGDMGPLELPVYNAITSNVSDYISSYKKIMELKPKIILSAHFPPINEDIDIQEKYKNAIDRIIRREKRVLDIIKKKKNPTIREIASKSPTLRNKPVYSKINNWLVFAEKVQVLNHLKRLKHMNRVMNDNQGHWYLI